MPHPTMSEVLTPVEGQAGLLGAGGLTGSARLHLGTAAGLLGTRPSHAELSPEPWPRATSSRVQVS